MAYHSRKNIVTDGLVFYVDAGNKLTNQANVEDISNMVNVTEEGEFINQASLLNDYYTFDGADDQIRFGDIHNFERTDTFSVSSWFRTTDATAYIIGNNGGSGNNGYAIAVLSGKAYCFLSEIGGGVSQATRWSNTIINNYDWVNIIFTYNPASFSLGASSGIEIYINGVLDTGATEHHTSLNGDIVGTVPLCIGARDTSLNLDTDGDISVCCIYNKELTSEEVKQNYEAMKHRFH